MNIEKNLVSLVYYILKISDSSIVQERIRNIYDDNYKCLTSKELYLKQLCDSVKYLFNNINQVFDNAIITKSYFLLTNEILDKEITKKIIDEYYKYIDEESHSLAALLHLYILNNVQKNGIEFAFLVSNYIMLKKKRWFIIPYAYCHREYKESTESNDLSTLILLFYDIEIAKIEKCPCLLSKNEVILKTLKIKNELINKYKISKLYLFGSFAKGCNTDVSDLDFVVIFNESLINTERNKMLDVVNKYLNNQFNCDVDVLDFSYALATFNKSQMEYLITLI